MIKVLSVCVALLALALLNANGTKQPLAPAVPVAPIVAIEPVCSVTMEKFLNMKEGMSRYQIERDIGCPGQLLSSRSISKIQTVTLLAWSGNSPSSKVRAVFRNDSLISKAQEGLK
ncbi:MAG TPA: hypothetical protein VGL45_17600 [Bradyrhizobium sp.]